MRRSRKSSDPPTIFLIPEYGDFGGARTYFKALLLFYRDRGYRVVAALEKKLYDDDIALFLRSTQCEYRLYEVRPRTFPLRKLNSIALYIDRFLAVISLLRPLSPALLVVTTGAFVHIPLFLLPFPLLYILHTYPAQPLKPLEQGILRAGMNTKQRVLTVSAFAVDAVRRYWLSHAYESRFVDKLFPVQLSWFTSEPVRQSAGADTVLTLGHVALSKNPEVWIQVARRVVAADPGVKFLWLGGGYLTDEYLNACRASVADEPRIEFAGFEPEPASHYERCIVYFQPSRNESYGLSAAEALRIGIPCVVAKTGGLMELVTDGENGRVCEMDDVDGMAQAILGLLSDDILRAAMGRAARARFQSQFSLEHWRREMIRIHDDLLRPDKAHA